jgi:DnaJ-class molecular chaperone
MERDFKEEFEEKQRKRKLALKILGITEDTSIDDIRDAYHYLALQNHPDKNPKDKTLVKKFININNAYEFIIKGSGQPQAEEDQIQSDEESKYNLRNGWGYYNWWKGKYADHGSF